jgi:hypothetical protein
MKVCSCAPGGAPNHGAAGIEAPATSSGRHRPTNREARSALRPECRLRGFIHEAFRVAVENNSTAAASWRSVTAKMNDGGPA